MGGRAFPSGSGPRSWSGGPAGWRASAHGPRTYAGTVSGRKQPQPGSGGGNDPGPGPADARPRQATTTGWPTSSWRATRPRRRLRLGRAQRGRGHRQPDGGAGPVRQGMGARAGPRGATACARPARRSPSPWGGRSRPAEPACRASCPRPRCSLPCGRRMIRRRWRAARREHVGTGQLRRRHEAVR